MNIFHQIYSVSRPIQRLLTFSIHRNFKTSTVNNKREIQEITEGNKTIIQGLKTATDPSKQLTVSGNKGACPLCRLGFKVDYTDVLILRQFLTPEGNILPKGITGLCDDQHRTLKKLTKQAFRAGLLTELQFPEGHPRRTGQRSGWKWKQFNVYFDNNDKHKFS